MEMGDIMYKGKAFFSFLFSDIVSMHRLIGLLTVALMAGAFGCGGDSDPMKSDKFAGAPLVGAWWDTEWSSDWVFTFNADGTFSELTFEDRHTGKWSLIENKFTMTYDAADMAVFNETWTVVSLDGVRFEFDDEDGDTSVWEKKKS